MLIAIRGAFSNKKGRSVYTWGLSAKNFNVKILIINPTIIEPVSPMNIFLSEERLNPKKAIKLAFNVILNKA